MFNPNTIVSFVADRSILVVGIVIILTLILVYPFINMAPTEQASPNPPGEVYDLQKDIDDKFPTPVHFASYVLEPKNGDVLTSDVLLELKRNKQTLFDLDSKGLLAGGTLENQPYLFSFFDTGIEAEITGISSILDSIEIVLFQMGTTLDQASDQDIKVAFSRLLSNPKSNQVIDFLSRKATFETSLINGVEVDLWSSPAMFLYLIADNEKLGGGGLEIGLGGGEDVINKEHLNRNFREVIEGNSQVYNLWGVAIDSNLESEEEGSIAGIFITFTVIGALLVVGLSLKSYWATAISGVGLGILMIWLKGISALIGLKSGLVIDLIVPIGMISLGVDFVVHAIRRYKEELHSNRSPNMALKIGLSGVLGALVLAMLSDGIAFLSNLSSNIEAVIHFGSAAAIAVFSSFVILGIIAPIVSMKIDELILNSTKSFSSNKFKFLKILGAIGVANASGGAVILMVALDRTYGLIMLLATIAIFIALPVIYLKIRSGVNEDQADKKIKELDRDKSYLTNMVEKLVLLSAKNPIWVISITAIITSISIFLALKLEPTFDVKDFFDSKSEFVIGLDKLEEHLGDTGGEPGIAYIKGDLMQPEAILRIDEFIESLRDIDNVAETPSGEITIGPNVVNVSRRIMASKSTLKQIEEESGIIIQDADLNGIPDSREDTELVFRHALSYGISDDLGNIILRPDEIRGAIYLPSDDSIDELSLTTVSFQIPGTRDQKIVTEAGDILEPIILDLEKNNYIEKTGLTGSPFTREEQLTASSRTLYTSLPIAIAAATLLLFVAMRSLKYAVITVIPIILVVSWTYAVMYIAGFALNFVTAIIGAISIGVGIDYSIHMTQRFREELRKQDSKFDSIRVAARGTGMALLGSAASSVVGFTIMGFAPMPVFSSYGQITAVMIVFALIASLIVLPCLLVLITREQS
ncbi:MAG: RND family transporter [Dehalococcoidia bacterium]